MRTYLNLFLAFTFTLIGSSFVGNSFCIFKPSFKVHSTFAAEIFDLNAIKKAQLLKSFVGSYLNYDTDALGSLFIQDDKIQFLYSSKGLTYFVFSIPMDFQDVVSEYSTDDLENGKDEIRYSLQDSKISKIRITENKNRQIVETLKINLSVPGEIEIIHSRKYYIKKGVIFKIWVIDDIDTVALNDTFEKVHNFKKTSSVPIDQNSITELRTQILKPFFENSCGDYLSDSN